MEVNLQISLHLFENKYISDEKEQVLTKTQLRNISDEFCKSTLVYKDSHKDSNKSSGISKSENYCS